MKCMIIRAAKTFVQAAIVGGIAAIQGGVTTWQALAIAAGTAGVAAVMNMPAVKKFFKDYGEFKTESED